LVFSSSPSQGGQAPRGSQGPSRPADVPYGV
jgi:hypothetical protein